MKDSSGGLICLRLISFEKVSLSKQSDELSLSYMSERYKNIRRKKNPNNNHNNNDNDNDNNNNNYGTIIIIIIKTVTKDLKIY